MSHRSCGSSFALKLTLSGLKALFIYRREELRTQFRKQNKKKIPIEQDRKVHIELSFCSDSTWTVASEHLEILELLFILSFSLYFRAQSSLRWWKTGWATWWRRMRQMSRLKHKSGPETPGIAGRTVTTDLIYLIVPEKCFNDWPVLIQNVCTGSSIGVKRCCHDEPETQKL